MSKPIVRRLVLVLALSAFLGSPAVSLAGARPTARHSRTRPVTTIQTQVSRLWNALVGVWEKNGCGLEPYGQCSTNSQESSDNGCGLEPYGRCTPSN